MTTYDTVSGKTVEFGGRRMFNPITPGSMTARDGPWGYPAGYLKVYGPSAAFDPGCKEWFSLEVEMAVMEQEHDVGMGSGWRHVDTFVYAAIAARARRCWHDLRRGLTPCDSFGGQDNNGYFNDTWKLISTPTPPLLF